MKGFFAGVIVGGAVVYWLDPKNRAELAQDATQLRDKLRAALRSLDRRQADNIGDLQGTSRERNVSD
jgi:hypothetical protein